MKSLRFSVLCALFVLVLAPAAMAADFGVRAGRYNDVDDEFVGAEMVFDIGPVNINPNIEYILDSDVTAGTANLDVTFDFLKTGNVHPYVGAGVGVFYVDTDFGDNTDTLLNVIGGVSLKTSFLTPYAQVKWFRSLENNDGDNDDLALTVGLRF